LHRTPKTYNCEKIRKETNMKRPAEKLYRIRVVLTWFERCPKTKQTVLHLSARALRAITARDRDHITTVEIKRRFRV
jgi:hypothetical protein